MFGEIKYNSHGNHACYSKCPCPLSPVQSTAGYIVASYTPNLRIRFPEVIIYNEENIIVMFVTDISLKSELQEAIDYMNTQLH